MIQTPSNTQSERNYLAKWTHTVIITCPLNLKIDFEKTLKIFFFPEIKFLNCYI